MLRLDHKVALIKLAPLAVVFGLVSIMTGSIIAGLTATAILGVALFVS